MASVMASQDENTVYAQEGHAASTTGRESDADSFD